MFRPITGHEILMNHNVIINPPRVYGPNLHIEHKTDAWFGDTQEELRQHIANHLSVYGQNKNWGRLAAYSFAYVYGKGAERENSRFEIEERLGEVYAWWMKENRSGNVRMFETKLASS
ncbi:hypothetical protein F2Q69_00028941 [Brassica cretica]|uniref:Uncharacterized protein n=1 Tax=Brassica cretica TaxID=69181 RepID=A0A8S9SAW7_BRACR|nr:hypothetical protein F2Q69_00028941 [Brassica cretica]